jgi:hypothetical protein
MSMWRRFLSHRLKTPARSWSSFTLPHFSSAGFSEGIVCSHDEVAMCSVLTFSPADTDLSGTQENAPFYEQQYE